VFIFLNGELVPSEQATISIYDHGYLYGLGLFETFRTYNGEPFLLSEHMNRLETGCQQMGLVWNRDDENVKNQIRKLLRMNELEDGYFRYNLSAGPNAIGLPSTSYTNLTESLFVKALPQTMKEKRISTVQTRRNTPEGPQRLKSHHYLNNILAKRETPQDAEGVFLSMQGKVAEGIVSNLFFVKDQVIYTPSLSTGILNGITRSWVIEAGRILGYNVYEGEYELSFAQSAEEVFMTNSIQEIVAVTEWDGHQYQTFKSGQVTTTLQKAYEECTGILERLSDITNILGKGGARNE
jgi:4-amino-4-deoxychorismate lyase